MPVAAGILVSGLHVDYLLLLWIRIASVVGVVVALRLTVCHGYRGVSLVAAVGVADTCLGVEEVEVVMHVEHLVHVSVVLPQELVVLSVGGIAHVAVLQVGEHVPVVEECVGCLHEHAVVVLLGVGIIIVVFSVASQILLLQRLVGDV